MSALSPDEAEVRRRNLIAQLQGFSGFGGKVTASFVGELIAVLEALKPVVVDRAADCMQTEPHAPHQVADLEEGVWRDCAGRIEAPPTREQIAEAMHNDQMETHAWRDGCSEGACIPIFLDRADAVLAALPVKPVAVDRADGLRGALEKMVTEADCRSKRRTSEGRGPGAETGFIAHVRNLLAVHPAVPAALYPKATEGKS